MLFPTLDFAIFFVVVFAAAWAMRWRAVPRKVWLLAASYFFYGYWDWRFLLLLLAASLIAWGAGLAIARADDLGGQKRVAGLSIAVLLAILGMFKYYEFFVTSLGDVLAGVGLARDLPLLAIVLPVGISFFTFQAISYVVDVLRGEVEAKASPLDLLLYVSFFPQLVAGPIVRAADFLPQLERTPRLTRFMLASGLTLIAVGLVKKMVVANWLATHFVDDVFLQPGAYDTAMLLTATYGYAVQIYCDFSGYSDIAIGTALLLGYRFRENFRQPYRAATLQEFWRRWHISLSQWLRDYLYVPLGGNRRGAFLTYRNLFLTMFLGGLWHGAAWNFVIWGTLHGGVLGIERFWRRALGVERRPDAAFQRIAWLPGPIAMPFVWKVVGVVVTFHFVCLCWIFFRASDFATASTFIAGIAAMEGDFSAVTRFQMLLVAVPLVFHFTPRDLDTRIARTVRRWPASALALLFAFALLVIWWVSPPGTAPFIYFQF